MGLIQPVNTKERKDLQKPKTIKKMPIEAYVSINVNGLSAPTKRFRLTEWIQKQNLYVYYLQETHSDLEIHTDGK